MPRTVMMHFGDGTNKELEMESDDPHVAVEEARTWVGDNAWFEVTDDNDNVIAACDMHGYRSI